MISGQFPGEGKPGPVAFPVPSAASVVQDGKRVVTLPKLVELKLASGQAPHRLKDLADVQQMIHHLILPRDFANAIDPSLRESFQRLWDDVQKAAKDEF
jgi:hypothetical protein